jgi:hypothetical protein
VKAPPVLGWCGTRPPPGHQRSEESSDVAALKLGVKMKPTPLGNYQKW